MMAAIDGPTQTAIDLHIMRGARSMHIPERYAIVDVITDTTSPPVCALDTASVPMIE